MRSNKKNKQKVWFIYSNLHPYHIVPVSPWPFIVSLMLFNLVIGGVTYLHFINSGGRLFFFSFIFLLWSLYYWWSDIIFEATYQGCHTKKVQNGLRLGMILFIVSEIMFFFAFFWAFFHSSISPAIQIGGMWPPLGMNVFNPFEIPLLNTFILLLSGVWATIVHHIMKNKLLLITSYRKIAIFSLLFAILLGLLFTGFQLYEYTIADFNISDSIYGSVFYLATGFHGFHVLMGTTFLIVIFFRLRRNHFTNRNFLGVDAGIWYWHFVDVVWLFLFMSMYWWGS